MILKTPLTQMSYEHHRTKREVKRGFYDKEQAVPDLYVYRMQQSLNKDLRRTKTPKLIKIVLIL